jgi:hypothetical protein
VIAIRYDIGEWRVGTGLTWRPEECGKNPCLDTGKIYTVSTTLPT